MRKKSFTKTASSFISILQELPIIVPAVLASFGVLVVGLLILGSLHNGIAIAIGLPASVFVFIAVLKLSSDVKRVGSAKEQQWFDVLVVFGIIVWVLVGVRYTAQNVFVYRDPGIYTVAAEKIRQSPSLDMEATEVFGSSEAVSTASAAFGISALDARQLSTQGLHLFPALLGLVGRATNQSIMLHAGPLFGGTALLAIYGFARLLVKPRWAAFAVGVLSVSLPFIYFSRDTYTELLAATFTFGALSLLWLAQKTGSLGLWALAGVLLGAGTLTRVDAYLTIAAVVFALACYHAASSSGHEKKQRSKELITILTTTILVVMIGWLDLTQLASAYYNNLRTEFLQQVALISISFLLGAALILISQNNSSLKLLWQKNRKNVGIFIIGLSLIVTVVLASRPLWLVSHGRADVRLIAAAQESAGVRIEANRNYAENSMIWLMWYVGLPILLASFMGGALMVRRVTKRGGIIYLLPFLFVVGGTMFVYLVRPSITADQVWASRRFIPVIIPGVVILGVYALQWLSVSSYMQRRLAQQSWGLLIALCVAAPLYYTYPFLRERTYTPQLQQINELCSELPSNAAIVWVGTMSQVAPRTSNVFCGFPSIGYSNSMQVKTDSLAELARSARGSGFVPVVGSDERGTQLLPAGSKPTPLSPIQYNVVPSTIFSPPRGVANETRTIYVGVVGDDGTISPLNSW